MNVALAPDTTWRMPSRSAALGFWLRSRVLRAVHFVRVLRVRVPRHARGDALRDAPILASRRTPLWRDADAEFALTAGKVHNLRIAARALDGVVVPAGACFSFWRQLGKPTARRGFTIGREVRAGCVIPTLAGGICQLSNALATCAAQAGFELVERHAHTARVDGDADSIDATVFWNYVDLKIRAPVDWRIEVRLDAETLIVALRAHASAPERAVSPSLGAIETTARTSSPQAPALRNCFACDETQCFRHRASTISRTSRETWLIDAFTPELLREWRDRDAADSDSLLPVTTHDLRAMLGFERTQGDKTASTSDTVRRTWLASVRRIAWQRWCARRAGLRQRSIVDGQRWLAAAYARRLRPEATRLVIDQALLPHLGRCGALGGRRYDVFASALPMREIESRLDAACRQPIHQGAARATLSDFRVEAALADAEMAAMQRAERVITPHADVAAFWRARGVAVKRVAWMAFSRRAADVHEPNRTSRPLAVFPASALARKGAYVLAAALRGIDVRLRVLGTRSDDVELFRGLDVEYASFSPDAMNGACVVVLPAYIEHNPRGLIAARSRGIRVVATPACGIDADTGVRRVEAGDVDALRRAILAAIELPR